MFEGSCGLNGSACTREASAGRKKRSAPTGNPTQDWINSLFEMDQPSAYAKRLLGDMHNMRKEKFRNQTKKCLRRTYMGSLEIL